MFHLQASGQVFKKLDPFFDGNALQLAGQELGSRESSPAIIQGNNYPVYILFLNQILDLGLIADDSRIDQRLADLVRIIGNKTRYLKTGVFLL